MNKLPSWPQGKKVAFVIRDDDLSYFTKTKMLQKLYGDFWKRGFKISFGAVSNIMGSNNTNVPPQYRGDGNIYPIFDNSNMVDYVSDMIIENKADVILHGYNHTDNMQIVPDKKITPEHTFGPSEFYKKSIDNIDEKITLSLEVLEKTFNKKITVFAPPQNYLSYDMWEILRKNNLSLCAGANIKKYLNLIKFRDYKIKNFFNLLYLGTFCKKNRDYINKVQWNSFLFSEVNMLFSSRAFYCGRHYNQELRRENFEIFKDRFEKTKRAGGYFILSLHCHDFFFDWDSEITRQSDFDFLNKILSFADSPDVWKCTLSELHSYLQKHSLKSVNWEDEPKKRNKEELNNAR